MEGGRWGDLRLLIVWSIIIVFSAFLAVLRPEDVTMSSNRNVKRNGPGYVAWYNLGVFGGVCSGTPACWRFSLPILLWLDP